MKKFTPLNSFKLIVILMSFVVSTNVVSQLNNTTYDFNANSTGWTGNITRTTATSACGSASMRRNLYSFATTGNLVSPQLPGTNNQGQVTVTYKYKAANWSANTVGTNPWGSFDVQVGNSATGPWTTVATVSQQIQNGTCITQTHTFTPPSGNLFLKWDCFWSAGDYYINFDDIVVSQATPVDCSGTPNPGTAAISPSSGCSGANVTLSASGLTSGTGISYQWQSGPSATGPWTNVTGATFASSTVNPTTNTFYSLVTTCGPSGLTNTSNSVSYTINTCTASVTMTDAFGDGWNGATMNVVVNGTTIQTISMASGGSQTINYCFPANANYSLDYTSGGTFAYEVGVNMTVNGSLVYNVGYGGAAVGTTLVSGVSCPIPTCPTLSSPINGTSNVSFNPTLSWTAGTNNATYDVYLSTNQTLVNNQDVSVRVSANQVGTSFSATGLSPSSVYYWRVVPISTAGSSATGCSNFSFTTQAPSPTLNSSALNAFSNTCVNAASSVNSFNVSGLYLAGDVTINALSGFGYSLSSTGPFTSSLTITASGTLNNTPVYVQFNPTSAISYNGNITASSSGANTINIAAVASGISPPTINAGLDFSICPGQSSIINGTSDATSSGVSLNSGNVTISGVDNTNPSALYTFNGLPAGAIISGITVNITQAGGVYCPTWYSVSTLINNVQQGPAGCAGTTTYTNFNGQAANGLQIRVNGQDNDFWADFMTISYNVTLSYYVGVSLNPTFAWTPNTGLSASNILTPNCSASTTTNYTLTVTGTNGCTASDQVLVTVLPGVSAGTLSGTQTICEGASSLLTSSGASGGAWSSSNSAITTVNSNGLVSSVGAGPSTISYTVLGIGSCPSSTATYNMTVNTVPTVNAGVDLALCPSQTSVINAVTNATSGVGTINSGNVTISGVDNTNPSALYTFTGLPAGAIISGITVNITQAGGIWCPSWYSVSTLINNVQQGPAGCAGTTTYTNFNGQAANGLQIRVNGQDNDFWADFMTISYTVTLSYYVGVIPNPIFVWTPGTGLSASNVLTPTCSATTTTNYTLTVTGTNGCSASDQVLVTVNPLPNVNAGIDQAVCIQSAATLSGSGATTYTWDNGVVDAIAFNPTTTTTYTVTGVDGNGCVNQDQILVTVNPLPNVNAGLDQAVCIQSAATLSGSGATTYTWDNGVVDAIAFNPSITTTYTVTGVDVNGCVNQDQILVTVNPLPNVNAGLDQTICLNDATALNGSGALTYTWDNNVVDGVNFNPSASTTYTVTGVDSNGCVNLDQVLVNVNALPLVSAGLDTAFCINGTVTLSGSGANSYQWTNNVLNGVSFNPTNTNTYTVTGLDLNGCANQDQVLVTVYALPNVSAGQDYSICLNTQTALNGTGAASYTWNNNVTNGVSFTPTITNTYTVVGIDANGCVNQDQVMVTVYSLPSINAGQDITICSGNSTLLSASGAVTYIWNNGVVNGQAFTPTTSQTYVVTGTNANGCSGQDALNITVNYAPIVSLTTGASVCANGSVALSATSANAASGFWITSNGTGSISPNVSNDLVVYHPSEADPATVNFSYVAFNQCGTANSSTAITVLPLPTVNAGQNISACTNSNVMLTATIFLAGSVNGGTVVWNSGLINSVPFSAVQGITNYIATATATNGCINADTVTVTGLTLPSIVAGTNQSVCAGETVTLNGAGGTAYTWNNGAVDGLAFVPISSGMYTVTGTGSNGCTNQDAMNLTVNALPNAGVVATDPITLGATPPGANYQWINCANGQALAGANNDTLVASSNGSYAVVVTNANGCSDTSECMVVNQVGLYNPESAIISLFPNPTNGMVTIELPSQDGAAGQIFDAQGKLVMVLPNISNGAQVDLSMFTTGIYTFKIQLNNLTHIEKVVKQ